MSGNAAVASVHLRLGAGSPPHPSTISIVAYDHRRCNPPNRPWVYNHNFIGRPRRQPFLPQPRRSSSLAHNVLYCAGHSYFPDRCRCVGIGDHCYHRHGQNLPWCSDRDDLHVHLRQLRLFVIFLVQCRAPRPLTFWFQIYLNHRTDEACIAFAFSVVSSCNLIRSCMSL